MNNIIWDLGGVLIDWNPGYVFTDAYFGSAEKRKIFFEEICPSDWNENQDAGYPIARATEERVALFPEWEKPIRDFYGRWEEMLGGPLADSVELFRELKQKKGLRSFALTNWSAETFPIALERFDFLHWFDGRVVSGEERTRKPFPEFYRILLDRYAVKPEDALFIDDNLRNVKAAEALGIRSVQFQSAQLLRDTLRVYNLI
ncbi:MAG: HAD family hydrolase [Chitinophagaceae bacterium]